MKRITTLLVACNFLAALAADYSGYTLTVEATAAVIESNGTTYRFYVNSNNPNDRFSSVFGNNQDHLIFDTPGGIFNSALNEVWNASEISPTLLAVFPELIDDSFATVNLTVAQDFVEGAQDASLVEDSGLSPTVFVSISQQGHQLECHHLDWGFVVCLKHSRQRPSR